MARKPKSKIGINLYNLREYLKEPAQIARTLKRVAKIGIRCVQASGLGPVDPVDLRRMADDAGVAIIGAHIGVQMMRDDLSEVIDRLHTWDCKYVAVPSAPGEERRDAAGWWKLAKEFSRIGRKFAKEGITLQYHNHHFEFTKFGVRAGKGGRRGIDILYGQSDPEALQAELDIGWVARAGADPVAYIRSLKGRLDQVHVKDWGIADGEPTWMPIGEGNLNWPPILKACRGAGTKHYIYEQDNCPTNKDPFDAAAISLANLHELGIT